MNSFQWAVFLAFRVYKNNLENNKKSAKKKKVKNIKHTIKNL